MYSYFVFALLDVRQQLTCCVLCVLAVPNISLSVLKPNFLEILLESHIVMFRVSNNKRINKLICFKRKCIFISFLFILLSFREIVA